ncbi:MAG: acyl-CoA thioesterase [Deltaproteobacteria bacterium]|nr:acyl-CoA thioesterase [Deltaproteobacteria bacterium]
MTQVVLPQFANALGTVFGGQIMAWLDICAAVSAQRHARGSVVTASIDSINFIAPVKQGQVVVLHSQVNAVFKSSMEIGVTVRAEDPFTGEQHEACRAYCTFVALDMNGHPVEVLPIKLETPEEEQRSKEAHERRRLRLEARSATRSMNKAAL